MPSLPPEDRHLWLPAMEAMQAEDWGLTVSLLSKCVLRRPDYRIYREVLHHCQRKLHGEKRRPLTSEAKERLIAIREQIEAARLDEDWATVDRHSEEGLAVDPWNVQLNLDVADAAAARGFLSVEGTSLMSAFRLDLQNRDVAIRFADCLYRKRRLTDAIRAWEHIQKLSPDDPYPAEMIERITAEIDAASPPEEFDD